MSVKLIIFIRWLAIIVLIVAIAFIILRWRFPAENQKKSRSVIQYLRELWLEWRKRSSEARQQEKNIKLLKDKTALLVDPEEKSLRVMEWKLINLGCSVIKTKSGIKGLELALENPDFLIVDSLLPDMPAVDFYNNLKIKDRPVIFVGVLPEQWNELRSLGGNVACVGKPYDPDEVASIAGYMLKKGNKEKYL